jgi:MOSC domain-containing protein YiiM
MEHVAAATLEAGVEDIRRSPPDVGRVELIVRRPAEDEREVLEEATLDSHHGLVGDTWLVRDDHGGPDADAQLTVMNARAALLVAGEAARWQLAGDQLYVDLDLSVDNVPVGTRLELGSAVIEVTAKPHLGCQKFSARFGRDALNLVNSPVGRRLRLRGANARVVRPGTVRVGDVIRKLPDASSA